MNKLNLSLIGFFQALGVVIYCGLVVSFLQSSNKFFGTPPGFLGSVLILVLLVFSAAVSGSIVFGYPAYLALNQRIREAVTLIVYTLLYCLGLMAIIIIILVVLG